MIVKETTLNGVKIIEPKVYKDDRGFFLETYSKASFEKHRLYYDWIQDNHSFSKHKHTIRGLHFQRHPYFQAKLIRVISGSILDIVVDLRKNNFGSWESFKLHSDNFSTLLIPRGLAHGFCTLEDNTEVIYKVDNLYSKTHEEGIVWNDPQLNIPWPTKNPHLSQKDKNLSRIEHTLPET